MASELNNTTRPGNVWRGVLWSGLALLLLLPALAMQVTSEVDWSASDFMIMGLLMALLGLGIEAAMRFLRTPGARLLAVATVVLVFLAIWVELAVGVFGTPFAGS